MRPEEVLVVGGAGQVGSGLRKAIKLTSGREPDWVDLDISVKSQEDKTDYKILFFTIPFESFETFSEIIHSYNFLYKPQTLIIMSTVPIGTLESLQIPNAFHFAVRGTHPDLSEGLMTFIPTMVGVKYHQSINPHTLVPVFQLFIPNFTFNDLICVSYKTSEAAKLFSLARYALDIVMCKAIDEFCTDRNINFSQAYSLATTIYNQGWMKLLKPQYLRPNLIPTVGPIGGHCVMAAVEKLLDSTTFDENLTLLLDTIKTLHVGWVHQSSPLPIK
jgi:hypothetical protein